MLPPGQLALTRRALIATAIAMPALRTPAATPTAPTFTLKGIPGISSIVESDAPRPTGELGIIGRGKDNAKSGRLNFCDRKGCISSFSAPEQDSYVPPWTYSPEGVGAISSFSSPLKRQQAESRPAKTLEAAQVELRKVVEAYPGAKIVREEPRYLYAEFEDMTTGAIDDVEFLLSQDMPLVGYRSAARGSRGNDTRQRERIRDLRKGLAPYGWKSVGRTIGLD